MRIVDSEPILPCLAYPIAEIRLPTLSANMMRALGRDEDSAVVWVIDGPPSADDVFATAEMSNPVNLTIPQGSWKPETCVIG